MLDIQLLRTNLSLVAGRLALRGVTLDTATFEALEAERWSLLHPESAPRVPLVQQILKGAEGPVVAASDSMKAVPDLIARWVPA
ncbi:MAG: hypothetical protein Q7J42_04915, partial [Sulfuritalea sp.]|nr:hypothetical protein [Sulfuritalea sp.]